MESTAVVQKKPLFERAVFWGLAGFCLMALLVAISTPSLLRPRGAAGVLQASDEQLASFAPSGATTGKVHAAERMVVRRATLDLVVGDLAAALRTAEQLAADLGGWVERSELVRGSASVHVRVPSARFDEARAALRKLSDERGNESATADDRTADFVDMGANLRNFRAEEASYLAIMQRSGAIKDTLSVAERLADVRGRIERLQGEMKSLSRQVEMATIAVTLRLTAAPSEPVRWRPLETIRGAWEDMRWGLAHYADAMIVVLFALPVGLVWAGTVLLAVLVVFRTGRWIWRRAMASSPAPAGQA